jgi:polyphosphate kinase
MPLSKFINRDISWLSFNGRVLEEAASDDMPIMERLKFLAIFSSNLDEFYRVRMPVLMALRRIKGKRGTDYEFLNKIILKQQERFGEILDGLVIPLLKKEGVYFISNERIPVLLHADIERLFDENIKTFLHVTMYENMTTFFPENNKLYVIAFGKDHANFPIVAAVNVPSDELPRFYTIDVKQKKYIIFLEDIIKLQIGKVLNDIRIEHLCNIKVNRDADLNLTDEFETELASKIERQLKKRDLGIATRLLYEPVIARKYLDMLLSLLHLPKKCALPGGPHHSYKDLFAFPLQGDAYRYPEWPAVQLTLNQPSLLHHLQEEDLMVHTPYHNYNKVLRFFKEAAKDETITEIYTTIYRVATESKILKALVKAAKNGKKVTVVVELKARFDEANNLKWGKKLKKAGVKIIYSGVGIKVHAKIALLKRMDSVKPFIGLLATGNLNENTARIYTDHILLTSHTGLLKELYTLFQFLEKKQKPDKTDQIRFRHLLVAQFNLKNRFLKLIEKEIVNAKAGRPASIIIKLNNLEEETLIRKLYRASQFGVQIELIVRGICCLRPGVAGLSENIRVRRIVDRYLEHGRIFIFHNNGDPVVYAGSADWMIRNIYRRIEVCFPIYDPKVRQELLEMIDIQLKDNSKAVFIGDEGQNIPILLKGKKVRSQEAIHMMLNLSLSEIKD